MKPAVLVLLSLLAFPTFGAPPQPNKKIEKKDDSPRRAAILALRAIDIAFENGAPMADIRRYQVEAAIKVDAVDGLGVGDPVRAVSLRYRDASRLLGVAGDGLVVATEKDELLKKYEEEKDLVEVLVQLNTELLSKRIEAFSAEGAVKVRADAEVSTIESRNQLIGTEAARRLLMSTRSLVRELK